MPKQVNLFAKIKEKPFSFALDCIVEENDNDFYKKDDFHIDKKRIKKLTDSQLIEALNDTIYSEVVYMEDLSEPILNRIKELHKVIGNILKEKDILEDIEV